MPNHYYPPGSIVLPGLGLLQPQNGDVTRSPIPMAVARKPNAKSGSKKSSDQPAQTAPVSAYTPEGVLKSQHDLAGYFQSLPTAQVVGGGGLASAAGWAGNIGKGFMSTYLPTQAEKKMLENQRIESAANRAALDATDNAGVARAYGAGSPTQQTRGVEMTVGARQKAEDRAAELQKQKEFFEHQKRVQLETSKAEFDNTMQTIQRLQEQYGGQQQQQGAAAQQQAAPVTPEDPPAPTIQPMMQPPAPDNMGAGAPAMPEQMAPPPPMPQAPPPMNQSQLGPADIMPARVAPGGDPMQSAAPAFQGPAASIQQAQAQPAPQAPRPPAAALPPVTGRGGLAPNATPQQLRTMGEAMLLNPKTAPLGKAYMDEAERRGEIDKTTMAKLGEKEFNAGNTLASFREIRSKFDPKFLTGLEQGKNTVLSWKEWAGGDLSPAQKEGVTRFEQFKQDTVNNLSERIKEVTGAAMGVQEEKRIRDGMPNMSDGPTQFKAKLDNIESQSALAIARYRYMRDKGYTGQPWDRNTVEQVMPLYKMQQIMKQDSDNRARQYKASNPKARDDEVVRAVMPAIHQKYYGGQF